MTRANPRKFHYVENWHPDRDRGITRAISKATTNDMWIVFNAPRPLFGHETWQGAFLTGIFYAAIDVRRADADWMIEENNRLDAAQIVYHSWEEVVYHRDQVCAARGIDPATIEPKDLMPSFLDRIQQDEA